ncbi:hypothetical protein [Micromonospora sp. NPDC023956]|uniref:hypothetical protein n=1 Tax=Micromonospora sp. NPDC023956 TaxID=3155722 RepID=UPI0033C1D1DD
MAADSARVTVAGTEHTVAAGGRLTFGRDRSCTVVLDSTDRGISRITGSVEQHGGLWCVVNRSRKRTLHVVQDTGVATPLPVSHPGWPPSRHLVDQRGVTVLVTGERWTHALQVWAMAPVSNQDVPAADLVSTAAHVPLLGGTRRAALVALAAGYLRRYPHYDPRPLTYQEAADLLGLRRDQIRKRIEHLRDELAAAGVQGLDGPDARRGLCEWFLSMRLIGPQDLDWLDRHRGGGRSP